MNQEERDRLKGMLYSDDLELRLLGLEVLIQTGVEDWIAIVPWHWFTYGEKESLNFCVWTGRSLDDYGEYLRQCDESKVWIKDNYALWLYRGRLACRGLGLARCHKDFINAQYVYL